MQICACLLVIGVLADAADITVDGYLARVLNESCYSLKNVSLFPPSDTVSSVKMSGVSGYDLVMKNSVSSEQKKIEESSIAQYHAGVLLSTQNRRGGIATGLLYSQAAGAWGGDAISLPGRVVNREAQLLVDGWYLYRGIRLRGGLETMVYSNSKDMYHHESFTDADHLMQLSSIGGYAGAEAHLPLGLSGSVKVQNTKPVSMTAVVQNSSGSALRRFGCLVEENSISGTIQGELLSQAIMVTGEMGCYDNAPTQPRSSVLPFELTGGRLGCSGEIHIAADRWRPKIYCGVERRVLDLAGLDAGGGTFLSASNNKYLSINGVGTVYTDRKSSFGLFYSSSAATCGDALIEYYPFTAWLLILDLPDAVKVYSLSGDVREFGVTGDYTWRISKNSRVKAVLSTSGMSVTTKMETAQRERYMGIIPVYRERARHSYHGTYAVVKAGFQYMFLWWGSETTLNVQQIVPLEIRRISSSQEGPAGGSSVRKRSVYGGLTVQLTATLPLQVCLPH